MTDGTVIGKHRGYPFYTVGQRKGLEIAVGEPLYVVEIQPQKNRVILGKENDLQRNGMWVRGLNMGKYAKLDSPVEALAKIRYKDSGSMAMLEQHDNRMKVTFNSHVKAIAPGQSAVFYDGNDLIGGGWIESSFEV
jgi:tRNA-uridine 2-sulfurtransferase